MADMYLYNSLSRKKEKFESINPPHVGMYACGMTVYDYAHIGHGRKYVGDDLLRRVLTFNGYEVNHVQNVTDVGHLVSDSDEGEDKLEKGARKFGKSVWEVAEYFTEHFYSSMDELNILRPNVICKATDHIEEQISMVKTLIDKGYAYDTPEAVYFDVSKFKDYGKLFGQKLEEKQVAVRNEVETGSHKSNPQDFALWFKRVGRFADHAMHWESPWGDGFPGWHIECSAMSMKYLGEQFDIHTGGEDHLPIHHPNEIAQSEAASGKSPFVKYWVHHAFLKIDGKKMSKSLGNLFTIDDVKDRGFEPLALRYLFLTAHYRDPINFTWESLESAQNALNNLRKLVASFKQNTSRTMLSEEKRKKTDEYRNQFVEHINNDLNIPQALAMNWEMFKSNIPAEDKYDLAITFDEVFGLRLREIVVPEKEMSVILKQSLRNATVVGEIPDYVIELVDLREEARKAKDFQKSDSLREELFEKGYIIEDSADSVKISKK